MEPTITIVSTIADLGKNGAMLLELSKKLNGETTKAPKEAAPAEETEEDFDLGDEPEETETEEVEAPTYEETREALQKYKAKHGKEKVMALLKKFNAGSSKALKPSQYADVIKAAKVK